ncbi:hypothetical protein NIES37_36760 [Tolypothrix tenuis PCC 7101]|uniref:Uncharacterized protein n=1 Tax=Tolypothrix tenuis PCC 7101 TaxID=231146 RepID=A0A1Z4N1U6_9CYAN|nr:hypothetical protein NIES37_36760 [Tolypothrix tenuis PCC 7101]BAZ76385.1 hypothetical protein NIES50_49830 [Aulosira laxa NIES-50]
MAYSDFKLAEIIDAFGLTIHESSGMFASIQEQECSNLLSTILKENVDLAVAISSKKARS